MPDSVSLDPRANASVDGGRGITRRRRSSGWTFLSANGSSIRDPAARRRILSLAIPPAWENVWINPDAHAPVQATGFDAAGRKQYRYHRNFRNQRDLDKFEALPAEPRRLRASERAALAVLE